MYAKLTHTWLLLFMIFIISWAGFANALTLQVHQQNNLQPSSTQQIHDTTSDCHQPEQSTSHQLQDRMIAHQMDCQDCHILHCQMTNSAVIPEMPILSHDATELNHVHTRTAYHSQNLTGYWQRILRPPKA